MSDLYALSNNHLGNAQAKISDLFAENERLGRELDAAYSRCTDLESDLAGQAKEYGEAIRDYRCLAELLDGHDATECRANLVKIKAELAELRAIFPAICEAIGNGSFCSTQSSVEFLREVPKEVRLVVTGLRLDLAREKIRAEENGKLAHDAAIQLAAEREQVAILRSDCKRLEGFTKTYRLRADENGDKLAAERALADKLGRSLERHEKASGWLSSTQRQALDAWKEARRDA